MAKKVQLSKKINGVVHQIYPKTVYDVVVDKDGKTLQQDITEINSDLERIEDSIPTKLSDLQGGAEIVTESEINAKLNNYYTKSEVNNKLENIESGSADLDNYYTKSEVDNKFKQDLSEYAKTSDLFSKDYNDLDNKPTIISESRVQELIDQAQFPEGGDIDLKNYYTKEYIDAALDLKQDTLVSGSNIKRINGKSILGSGDLTIDGGGSSIEIITSNDKTTQPSDENVYSALKVDNEFTRNNERETINEQWQFEDKTVFNGNVEFNKRIQKPAIFEEYIQSPNYTGNVLGSGWYLGFDDGTNSHLEVDTLKVRKKAIFDTLEIKHVAHVGGEIMLTPAGAKISKVEAYNGDEGYKCFFKANGEDEDGNQLNYQNEFALNDLVMCKTFNLDEGQQRYYWRKCIDVNYTPDENGYFWIALSKDDEDKLGTVKSDSPIAGDVIVTVGNSEDENRQNAIVISAYSSDAPSICLYKGIGTPDPDPDPKKHGNIYSLRDGIMPVRISPKGNKFTGKFTIENMDEVAGSLVEVLENLISFSVTGLSYTDLLGVNAVDTQVESGNDYVIYSLKEDVVKTWQQGDNVAIKLRFNEEALQNKTDITISLLEKLSGRFDENSKIIEAKDLENPSIKLFQRNGIGFESGDLHIKITGSENCLPYSIEARAGFNTELRRTGIDIENGTITLQSDATYIKTSDNNDPKTIAEFTEDKISFGLTEVDERLDVLDQTRIDIEKGEITLDSDKTQIVDTENGRTTSIAEFTSDRISLAVQNTNNRIDDLTGKVNNTSLILENGKITLDADETTIKDTDLTLAQFTRDQASISVYELYTEVEEDNVITRTENTGSSYQIVGVFDMEKVLDWDKSDRLKLDLTFSGPIYETTSIKIQPAGTTIFSTINLSIPKSITTITKTIDIICTDPVNPNFGSLNGILISGSILPTEMSLKRTHKANLKRTGIDIESGQITLDADKTVIKDGDDSFNIASFTKNQITLQTESEGNALLGTSSYDIAEQGMQGSKQIYYREYTLNSEVVSKWKDGEIITMSFVINPIAAGGGDITVFGSGDLSNILASVKEQYTLGTRVVQCSTVCIKDAANLAASNNLKLIISTEFPHYQGNLEIYSKLYGEIKKAGIDLNDGIITLNADTTKIKSGDKDIALFTVNDKGVAVLNTEFIDADRIQTDQLETEGTILNSGQKVNYLKISDDNLTVFNNQAVPKIKIHSGSLNSSGSNTSVDYKTNSSVSTTGGQKTFDLIVAEGISVENPNNYITFSDVKINLVWTNLNAQTGLLNPSSLQYDVVLRCSDFSEIKLITNQVIEPSITGITKTIILPSQTLSINKTYSLIIKFAKTYNDSYTISTQVTNTTGKASIIYPQNMSEIASDGYNFQFGTGQYQTAKAGVFEIVYGEYGFRISQTGIQVKRPESGWTSLFGIV